MQQSFIAVNLVMASVFIVLWINLTFTLQFPAKRKRNLSLMLLADIVMLVSDAARQFCVMQGEQNLERLFFCLFQVAHYAILICFVYDLTYYIQTQTPIHLRWAHINACVCAACSLLWIFVVFNNHLFDQATQGRVPVFLVASFGNLYMSITQISTMLRYRKALKRGTFLTYLMFTLCPILLLASRFVLGDTMASAFILSFFVFLLYEFVHVQQNRKAQQLQIQLNEAKLSVLINQTRPHFLYNTLNSIYYLCEKDPAVAQIAINDFAEFLRGNMESIETSTTIPLQREMEHVRHYLGLEKMRFQDKLQIEYRLDADQFLIPPLCVQMLVENAVKHGIEVKPGGGSVRIHSAETPDAFLVTVTDDGVGFDTAAAEQPGSMGIAITRQRLETSCGGTLTIRSEIGKGTEAVIRIPKDTRGKD